ncbi:MAG: LysR family transcriptional regulator [Proteobacteria bacterium]|nr:LysR family transcriptional regulator [Pseudomonadota bacterium]
MTRANWDDLRFVLAVIQEGSVSAAARVIGVNHATVLRRVAAFEAAHGLALFDKTARGYRIPPDRAQVIEAARDVDLAVQRVARLLAGVRSPLAGEIRITSTDSFCQSLLPPMLAAIADEAPDLRVSLISSNLHLDLARTAADITVRPTERLPAELVGENPCRIAFAVYGPEGSEDARGLRWLGAAGLLERTVPARWMAANLRPDQIGDGADSFLTLAEMVALGRGIAVLPLYVGDGDDRLTRLQGLAPPLSVNLWVASHSDLASVPRIALMRRKLAERFAQMAGRLG